MNDRLSRKGNGMRIRIIDVIPAEVKHADWSGAGEHILQSLKFEVQVLFERNLGTTSTG